MSEAPTAAHPLLHRVGRRHGKYDFGRYERLVGQQVSIGAGMIGKVSVDCCFLFKKSQWGVLTEQQNPAGVVYLDLAFHQPNDCRLESATVTVTLDDDDKDLVRQFSGGTSPVTKMENPVRISYFGPRQLNGQPRQQLKLVRHRATPYVEAGGIVGIGNMGRDSEKAFIQESRWIFNSHIGPDRSKKNSWAYRVLQWELAENKLEKQATHNNKFHTAFAFEHGGQPFFMKVEVDGKLKRRLWPYKFGSKDSATTLVNFGGRDKFRKPLDELAMGLPLAMEEENNPPREVPNRESATFHYGTMKAERLAIAATNSSTNRSLLGQQGIPTAQSRPILNQAPSTLGQVLGETESDDPTAPTISNLVNAFTSSTQPSRPRLRHTPISNRVPASQSRQLDLLDTTSTTCNSQLETDAASITVVGSEPESLETTDETILARLENTQKQVSKQQIDLEKLIDILDVYGILTIIKLIIGLMNVCGVSLLSDKLSDKDSHSLQTEECCKSETDEPSVIFDGNKEAQTSPTAKPEEVAH
ncbi:uncharacterized protein BCR38DRAFT_89643 [Pseudomassariella vexata]|uniref:Uncharacterized protein n=1 Tax=Pseudomassariella vexata TaxID=1141098 RepID=A0A1Y2EDK6_9PEZI|nr:uncharacterized protein BCR38DRAFT_89643 [Pseudomassariella vexata]ORY69652.1 hypothetical protein BCR38DRAFT_89643 [Pseudomassariella vexata]